MAKKNIFVLGLVILIVVGTLGFNRVDSMLPTAYAHGVQAQLQSRFVRIEDETFSTQSLRTGEILTIEGKLVSLVTNSLTAWLSIYVDSPNAGNNFEVLAKEPPKVFYIRGNSVVLYSLSLRALQPGKYHVHTQLNAGSLPSGLGPGQTVVVVE